MLHIICAARFENAPVIHKLNSQPGVEFKQTEFGIGVFNSMSFVGRNLQLFTGDDILFVGSCGTLGSFNGVEPRHIQQVHWKPLDERLGIAHSIEGLDPPIALDCHARFEPTKAYCTSNLGLKSLPHESDDRTVENIELYGVAHLLLPICKSFRAVLGTTNQVGETAHEQWVRNHKQAAQAVADEISTHLKLYTSNR